MVRIIEHGRIIERENDHKIKCDVCGCVFLFSRDDTVISAEIISFEENKWVNHHYIRCPDCGHDIYLGDNKGER